MDQERPAGGLRRVLGVGFGLAAIIGGTLGVGILRTPGLVAHELHAPGPILLLWIVGGFYTLVGSICLAEVGAVVPQAGGYYVYARRAFGDHVGFAVGWMDWIAYCAALGYVAIGMAEFLGVLVPPLAGLVRPIAIAALLGFVALQWAGVRISSRFQQWTTVLKCVAFVALIAVGIALAGDGSRVLRPLPAQAPTLGGIVAAIQVVIIAFGGWQSALYFTEEDRDPRHNLPRAMIGGVVILIVIYVLVNLALLMIVPMSELASSTLPAADAARAIAGERGRQVITILSITSLPPLLNALMMIGSRIVFALGRDRLVWGRTADVSVRGTPGVATVVTTLAAIILIATGTFERLGGVAAIFLAVNCSVCCLALIALRRTELGNQPGFRAWGYPWTPLIVVIGSVAFLLGVGVADPVAALTATGVLATGMIGYAAFVMRSEARPARCELRRGRDRFQR